MTILGEEDDSWENQRFLAEGTYSTSDEAAQFAAWGSGVIGVKKALVSWIIFQLSPEAVDDVFNELTDIIRFHYRTPTRALPPVGESSVVRATVAN